MATENNANIGFEKQFGTRLASFEEILNASEYKSVVLGLIFLKSHLGSL